MKKINILLLAILLLILTPHVSAETFNGSCGAGIMWTLDTETGVLNISGEGEMSDFLIGTERRPPWYWHRSKITTLVIEPGITRIGKDAFNTCDKLVSVSIPDTVTEIAMNAFAYCHSLQYIDLPNGLSEISFGAFQGSALRSVEIPESVTYIDEKAFRDCTALTGVILPEGLTEIGTLAFASCHSLPEILIPCTVTSIKEGAFESCGSLVNVFLHEGLTTIEGSAFRDCHALEFIVFPESLTSLGSNAFYNCTSLKNIKLPNQLISIGSYAFYKNAIAHLIIPASVQKAGDGIVAECNQLEKIAFLNSECTIGNSTSLGKAGKTIVYVHKGSTAEAKAIQHNFAYKYITDDNLWEDTAGIYNPFTDIAADIWYTDAVLWAVENGITNGRTESTFAPGDSCKRSEVVTFLHRSQGKPVPGTVQSEFTDVQIGKFYTDAVAWAVENNITNGMGDGTFGVNQNCTRAQVVTFLWRTAGCPAPESTECEFTDVKPGAFYYDAVLWAVENGITNGMGDGTFGVGGTCTRGQIVTFLYRFAG